MAAHLELVFELGELDPETAERSCFEQGALAVTFSNAGADRDDQAIFEPSPGELRLWQSTRVRALFDGARDDCALIGALAANLDIEPARLSSSGLADRAWEREWLRDFHAMRFGARLWVCPQHETVAASAAVIVHLDPGLAFGTGTHASTALCLDWLDGAAGEPGFERARVIDYGCGSGVLAIAALKLGAHSACGFDHDPQALLATRENAARNGVAARLQVCEHPGEIPTGCELLLANILAEVLIGHAAQFASLTCPRGRVLLSGILAAQEAEVAAAFAKWFDMRRYALREGWVALEGTRY